MLTKNDLDQIEQRVSKPLKEEVQAVEKRLSANIQSVEQRLSKQLKSIKLDLSKIKKDTSYTVNFLDREQLKLGERVKKIEKHLELPTPQSPV